MKNVFRILGILTLTIGIGTVGLMFIEGWRFLDALFMAVITITTVGFGEVHPLSDAGRIFIMLYLLVGLGVFLYGLGQMGEIFLRNQLNEWLGRRKMDSKLKKAKDHFIVCGFGRMGLGVCRELAKRGEQFVVIDKKEDLFEECKKEGWHFIIGDATDDRTLIDAGIDKAKGLAAVVGNDSDNLYTVFSARLLSKDLQIIAKASDEKSAEKLKKAGANRVVNIYMTSSAKVAKLMSEKNTEEFIEKFSDAKGEYDLAEVFVPHNASYAGLPLSQTSFSERGIMVVGIRKKNGELKIPPSRSEVIEVDDSLIVLGKTATVSEIAANK